MAADLLSAKDAFLAMYEPIQEYLLNDAKANMRVDDNRLRYLKKLMDVSCTGGKYNRGITVVEIAMSLTEGAANAVEMQRAAAVCGWAIEFMQAHFLVEDDIMDGSIMRRGKPCWYRHPGVTTQCAINDGLIVFAWATKMISHFLADHPQLLQILLMFHQTDYNTTIGQLYDVTSMFDSAKLDPDVEQPTTQDFTEYTLEHYTRIVLFKTAFYTYHVPMTMGLAVAGKLDSVNAKEVEELAMTMGEYFQVQDDFLDCYGDPAVIGKVGTDIEDKKCSWLAATLIQTASAEDVAEFKENYGSHDEAKVAIVKAIYQRNDLQGKFAVYEKDVLAKVDALFAKIAETNAAFVGAVKPLWERTYSRKK